MKLILQIVLPLLVLAVAGFVVMKLVASMEKPAVVVPPPLVPLVRTVAVAPQQLRLDVHSQGSVEPRAEVALAAQVSGRVIEVSPALKSGGFFAAGEVLLRIEPRDFELRLVAQQAAVAKAQLRLAQEQAEAAAAVRAWQQLEGERPADELVTRKLQVADAEQALAAAQAALSQAQLDLDRTAVTLPFAGRVRQAAVEVGQQVQAGAELARVYGTAAVEVRLPVADEQAAFVDLPLGFADQRQRGSHPEVELVASFGGRRFRWRGVVDRVEGEIDRRTRMLTVVARVDDPYAAGDERDRPPLAVGMFVEASIRGRTFADVVSLPRQALRADGSVLVVGAERRLHARPVEVLRLEHDAVLVHGGLAAGEVVCISSIDTFVDGMRVDVLRDDGSIDGRPAPAAEAK